MKNWHILQKNWRF